MLEPCTLPAHEHQVDPYVGCGHLCRYCYVLNQAETDWATEIMIHEDIEAQLEEELRGIEPQSVYMGWRTDPYQPCEADAGQTRKVLDLLQRRGFSAAMLTKSDLVLRDLDILTAMESASVSVSVAFDDDRTRRLFEGDTRPTDARIEALRRCREAGLRTSALICPVIPHVTDVMPVLERVTPHVDRVWVYGLSILDESEVNWRQIDALLAEHYPVIRSDVREAVMDKKHPYWTGLRERILAAHGDAPFELSVHF